MKRFLFIAAVLGVIAWQAPIPPYPTDRDAYLQIGHEVLQPGCSSIHCFRILIPAVIEHLPGPSLFKWKLAAVIFNAAAAVAVGELSLAFGFPAGAAALAAWLSALGFGSLFTLYDPHTADPFMYFLGPLLMLFLVRRKFLRAAVVGCVGVLGKEFAAVPLWIAAGANWLGRRRADALRAFSGALTVTTLWLLVQLVLIAGFDYTYAGSESTRILEGGYLFYWLNFMSARSAISAILTEYGALYLLFPIGLWLCGRDVRHTALAAVPAVMAFAYVQQPDRALWNFHFLATPLSGLALASLPVPAAWAFVAAFGAANLRLGAQLPIVPSARFGLVVSLAIAALAVVLALRRPAPAPVAIDRGALPAAGRSLDARERRSIARVLAVDGVALLLAAIIMLDLSMHWRTERATGINIRGYRGPVAARKVPGEIRTVVLGGSMAYGDTVQWHQSVPGHLEQNLRDPDRRGHRRAATTVVNLSAPSDAASTFVKTLGDYEYLQSDVVCIFGGADDLAAGSSPVTGGGRRAQSVVFRRIGYFPVVSKVLSGKWREPLGHSSVPLRPLGAEQPSRAVSGADTCSPRWMPYCDAMKSAIEYSLARGKKVMVVTEPYVSPEHVEQQRELSDMVAARFGGTNRVRYLNLGRLIDLSDRSLSDDRGNLTARANDRIAEALTGPLLEAMSQ